MANPDLLTLKTALSWHIDAGAADLWMDTPQDKTVKIDDLIAKNVPEPRRAPQESNQPRTASVTSEPSLLGASEAQQKSKKLAENCTTLEELQAAIADFDGLAIKKTATNMVFADGNPEANVMVIGEAPGADEDRLGKPFVGASGQLLDRILGCINLSRKETAPCNSVYISNILNWRPPGNRTPTPSEIEVSLPFIEKHIAIVKPRILILTGAVSAKSILGSTASISKLRSSMHEYKVTSNETEHSSIIHAVATYHPAYLLRSPEQKGLVWQDMLMINKKRQELKIDK